MKKCILYGLLTALVLSSCGGGSAPEIQTRDFPKVQVPSMISGQAEAVEYSALHWWDSFADTSKTWSNDAEHILGVKTGDVEQQMSNYAMLLTYVNPKDLRKSINRFCDRMEAFERRDAADSTFERMSNLFERYLYDPNSPMRDEELYLPFCERMSHSEVLDEAARGVYAYQASMCSLNRIGAPATDFTFCERNGRSHNLYSIKAEETLLFFSNPGCPSCKEIIEKLKSLPNIDAAIADGRLAVLNIYIDEDLTSWMSYMPIYPTNWYNGYDPNLIIREDELYNVRAIPSLYLLDSEKRVLMKDAIEDRVIEHIFKLINGASE